MVFVNPWAYHDPKDSILTPTPYPHPKNKESEGCLGAICGFILAIIIHFILFYLCFTLTKGGLRGILMVIEGIIICPIMVICFVNLSIKIEDKMCRNRKQIKRFFFPSKRDEIAMKIRKVQLLKARYQEEYKWADDMLSILWSENMFDRRNELSRLIKRCDFAIKRLKEEWKQMDFK